MAGTRLSGLISGMDTESIISQLVDARKVKVDRVKKQQTKHQWKQDAWKDLNKKLQNLQNKFLNNMRFSTSYMKKTTSVSNSSAVSVITGENAVNGVQSLKINQLAKTGYLTGAQLSTDGSYTALSKLSDLTGDTFSGEGTFTVKNGKDSIDISVNADTTVSDVLSKLKSAGLNASFDEKNQRFFVSAKESGADNDFSITASDANGSKALAALGLQVSAKSDSASWNEYNKYSNYYVAGDRDATLANMKSLIDADVDKKVASYLSQYKSADETSKQAAEKMSEIEAKYQDGAGNFNLASADSYKSSIEEKDNRLKEIEEELKKEGITDEEKETLNAEKESLTAEKSDLQTKLADATTYEAQQTAKADADSKMADITANHVDITTNDDGEFVATDNGSIRAEVENAYYAKAQYANDVVASDGALLGSGATKVNGQNASIELNGATFENTSNVFEINGLTFTALRETEANETITVTTENDTNGIYDMIKNYLKEYNSLINEMDKMYNAASAKDYEPLTAEEKDAMSETEVKEYENKIKDALLRRDENLNTVSQSLKEAMAAGYSVGGKTMHLSDFGINTLSYFTAPDNEKNAYHIDGDSDDDSTSGNADVLRTMIANDPSTVVDFFTKLSQNLYTSMSNQSKSVDGYRSFGSFYDDKKMTTDYNDYKSKIATMEEKLNDYEDKWYKKFAAMEKAMSKMQSNTSAVSALIGGGY